jgi:SRSO17 transposase
VGCPPKAFQRLSVGQGSKGERLYDWALTPLWRLQWTDEERAWSHALLVRRSTNDPEELAYYVVFAPREEVSLGAVAGVAGSRWRIEEGFEQAKGLCGLDEYEVRKYEAWHRHITLSLLAHAFLAAVAGRAVATVAVAAKEQKKGIQQATGPSTGPSKTGSESSFR